MSDSCLYGKRTEGYPVHCLSLSFPQPCPLDGKSREKVGAELLVAQEALCPSTSETLSGRHPELLGHPKAAEAPVARNGNS